MPADQYEAKYTKPDLRRRLKDRIRKSAKGGRKGQWSARKSQLLVQEYEKQGGGYKNDEHQKKAAGDLKKWTDQDWQTKEGSARARRGKTTKRYLPKKAWDLLTPDQKRATERRKTSARKQTVPNTGGAKAAQAYADHDDASDLTEQQLKRLKKDELLSIARRESLPNRSKMNKAQLARTLRKHFRNDA